MPPFHTQRPQAKEPARAGFFRYLRYGFLLIALFLVLSSGHFAQPSSSQQWQMRTGFGAGGVVITPLSGSVLNASIAPTMPTQSAQPQDCSIWIDPLCWTQNAISSIASWIANGILHTLQPIVDAIDSSSSNFITHTPICVSGIDGCSPSPIDQTLLQFMQWGIWTVDAAALTFIIGVIGYNIAIGRQVGATIQELSEAIPRIALVFLAATISPLIIQLFVDLNNVLCQGVVSLATITLLTNIIIGLIGTGLQDGRLIWLFVVALGVMNILLVQGNRI